jgi:hypothetical protein
MIKAMNLNRLQPSLKHPSFSKRRKEKYPKCLVTQEHQQKNKIKKKETVVRIKEAGIQQLRIFLKTFSEERR